MASLAKGHQHSSGGRQKRKSRFQRLHAHQFFALISTLSSWECPLCVLWSLADLLIVKQARYQQRKAAGDQMIIFLRP
jgi:hypothetical protein